MRGAGRKNHPLLGVVIPALNEEHRLPLLLDDLRALSVSHAVVVADGGSVDRTRELALERGARLVSAPRGRASQMNAGAEALETPWLLFLHADSRLPAEARRVLAAWIRSASPERSAHFRFRLDGRHWFWRFIETGQRLREALFGLAYGDQGILVSRDTFRRLDGFPDLPLLEDVEFLARIRRSGPVDRLSAPVLTSPRRYEQDGRWKGWFRNTLVIGLYSLGVDPGRLARLYPPRESTAARAAPEGRTLIVFAKAPTPGRVKTRLAEALGAEEASRLYRTLGRRVVDQVRGGSYRTIIYYDPPEAEAEVRRWLGNGDVEYRPQSTGDLGQRMARAFEECFRHSERVCIVGTDAPELDRARVEEAFRALDGADVVFGPAFDGGYYLLGLRNPVHELFREIPWSTREVLLRSEERARSEGLAPHFLSPLRDVDTLEDLVASEPGLS